MLYIVPTPIGNLGDITMRAIQALKECDFIIAENPLYTKKLLLHLEVTKPIVQFAEHNELKTLDTLTQRLAEMRGCLVTDAGTPGISDPGFRLVRACREQNIEIVSLPGANAAITALAGSGLPTDKFIFVGFLPKTEPKLIEILKEAQITKSTLIAYESPQRIVKTIERVAASCPECKIVIARELSKVHEEYIIGNPAEVMTKLKGRQAIKGEITFLVSFK